MTLTDKQKKLAWIAGAVLLFIHFAPGIWNNLRQEWAARNPPARAGKPSPVHTAPAVPSAPSVPVPPSPDAQLTKLLGIWRGNAVMPNSDLCAVTLELGKSPDKQGIYTGYSSMSCGPVLVMTGRPYTARHLPPDLIPKLAPVSTILSGPVENGEIHLKFGKSITTGPDGCQPMTFTLTPFAEALGAQFERGTCTGGKLVMRRTPR